MKRLTAILILIYCFPLLANHEIVLHQHQGTILIRHGLDSNWEPAVPGQILNDGDCLHAQDDSHAEIEISPDKLFHLPANSMVDVAELKTYSNSELLLILTSIEISQIPVKPTTPDRPSGAYVIHGNQFAKEDSVKALPFLEFEINGLKALFEQSVWPGVVLKIFKLKKFGKLVNQEELDYRLIVAYHHLNFVSRLEQEKKRFVEKYPGSVYLEEVDRLE